MSQNPQPIELVAVDEARAVMGGISRSAFYRNVQAGRFPRPIHLSANNGAARWLLTELEICKRQMVEARDRKR